MWTSAKQKAKAAACSGWSSAVSGELDLAWGGGGSAAGRRFGFALGRIPHPENSAAEYRFDADPSLGNSRRVEAPRSGRGAYAVKRKLQLITQPPINDSQPSALLPLNHAILLKLLPLPNHIPNQTAV